MPGPIWRAKKKAKGPRISTWKVTWVLPATWDIEWVITALAKKSLPLEQTSLKILLS